LLVPREGFAVRRCAMLLSRAACSDDKVNG
jgi:hypothetical protein